MSPMKLIVILPKLFTNVITLPNSEHSSNPLIRKELLILE